MPRISLPTPETMNADQKAVYDKIVSGPRGKIQGPLRAALHNAEPVSYTHLTLPTSDLV